MKTTGNMAIPTDSDEYRVSACFPVLDAMIAEFQKRFDNKNIELMKAIQYCHPESPNFLEAQHFMPFIAVCHIDSVFNSTMHLSKENQELGSVKQIILEILLLHDAFPVLLKLLQISLIILLSVHLSVRGLFLT